MTQVNKEHTGKRLLLKRAWSSSSPTEYTIIEVAPSGDYFKAKTPSGNASWHKVSRYEVVEELPIQTPNIPML